MSRFKKILLVTVTLAASAAIWFWFPLHPKPRAVIAGDSPIVFSGDSQLLATNGLKVWDVRSGHQKFDLGQEARHKPIAFSPGGGMLLSEKEPRSFHLWDLAIEKNQQGFEEFFQDTEHLFFSPEGWLVVGRCQNWDLYRLWDIGANQGAAILGEKGIYYDCSCHSTGRFAINGRVFRYEIGDKTHEWDKITRKDTNWPSEIEEVSQDGKIQVVQKGDYLELLEEPSQKVLQKIPNKNRQRCQLRVTFSPNGEYLIVLKFGEDLEVWGTNTGKILFSYKNLSSFHISPDGRFLEVRKWAVHFPYKITIWKVQPGTFQEVFWAFGTDWGPKEVDTLKDLCNKASSKGWLPDSWVSYWFPPFLPGYSIFSPDCRYLAVAPADSPWVKVVDVLGKKSIATIKNSTSPQFSPDSKTLATRSTDGTIKLWDIPPKKPFWARLGLAAMPLVFLGVNFNRATKKWQGLVALVLSVPGILLAIAAKPLVLGEGVLFFGILLAIAAPVMYYWLLGQGPKQTANYGNPWEA